MVEASGALEKQHTLHPIFMGAHGFTLLKQDKLATLVDDASHAGSFAQNGACGTFRLTISLAASLPVRMTSAAIQQAANRVKQGKAVMLFFARVLLVPIVKPH
jgi:hypothetical protein